MKDNSAYHFAFVAFSAFFLSFWTFSSGFFERLRDCQQNFALSKKFRFIYKQIKICQNSKSLNSSFWELNLREKTCQNAENKQTIDLAA